ncbi:unnamed protein product [Adineta ricciae]|uniref:Serine hydrolase domain-containing protein n=1 Tax=Adineta ricciae TaxID=249248 RepID=A0A814WAT5_ADIRI|nr:unnamed protein product [Adineta ricciae]CAF1198802.1 unnamed protein product [Adineta ricciae]
MVVSDRTTDLPLKILILPDFHQNFKLFKRNTKALFKALTDIATFHIANRKQLYHSTIDGEVQPLSTLSDKTQQQHLYTSVYYLDRLFKSEGPFDGILGLGEGASLAGILCGLKPLGNISFYFAILVSGLESQMQHYQDLMKSKSIQNVCSLHIYGTKDGSINNDRTLRLAAAFVDAKVITHQGSRFTPKTWPYAMIREFLLEQQENLSERDNTYQSHTSKSFDGKIEATILYHQRRTCTLSSRRKEEQAFATPIGLLHPVSKESIQHLIEDIESNHFDDGMLLVWCERMKFHQSESVDNTNMMTPFFHHWIQLYLKKPDEVLSKHLSTIPRYGDWGDMKTLYAYAERLKDTHPTGTTLLENLKQACVQMIGNQLYHDYEIALKQTNDNIKNEILISQCIYEAPFISNNPNELTTIMAKEVAKYIQILSNENRQADQMYRNLIETIRRQLKRRSLIFIEEQVAWKDRPLFCTRQQREEVLSASPASNVIHPQPQPIVPCPLEELQPLIEYLRANKPGPSDDKNPIVFPRGTMMTGGRLDLCKQAVGPQGVQPVLDAMKHSSTVNRLLLGNNIVGRPGAEAISDYIRFNPDSTIDTWYIACNRFDSDSIGLLCDALATDTKVKALWLKRNPILASGAVHIARMLSSNTCIQTLDLLNTGLLDKGCEILFGGLKMNRTLKHLYIDSNGLTVKCAEVIRRHFEENDSCLETLYLSCNALTDAGTCQIAAGLKHDKCLQRLSLASNSVGPDGARSLTDALIHHPSLQQLGLGFLKSTTIFGGLDNILGNEGAAEISRLIQFNQHIRSIDLARNAISEQGLIQLRDALKINHTLTSLEGLPSKRIRNKAIKKEIKSLLTANMIAWGKQVLNTITGSISPPTIDDCLKKGLELQNAIHYPEHIREINSYYRIH